MHAVVTGASSGIGAALSRQLHGAGARVSLVARRRAHLDALAAELGPRCQVIVRDLAEDAALHTAPPTWLAEAESFGPIDVFVNNAGIQSAGSFLSADAETGARLIDVDLLAPIALAAAVTRRMVARGSGVLVNVSSVAALAPPAGMARYAAAKAGLAAFSECLGAELAGTGVHVLTVYPGPIDNGAPQATYDLYGRDSVAGVLPVGSAAALARAMARAIARRRRRLVYPSFYRLAWWANPFARWIVARATPTLRAPSAPGR